MAEMRTELDAVQTFVDQCVLLLNAGELTPEDSAECKLIASELEGRVMDICVQLHGGAGYMEEYRISRRSEEHTSELQSLMRISYAVFCLKTKIKRKIKKKKS